MQNGEEVMDDRQMKGQKDHGTYSTLVLGWSSLGLFS